MNKNRTITMINTNCDQGYIDQIVNMFRQHTAKFEGHELRRQVLFVLCLAWFLSLSGIAWVGYTLIG